MIFSYNWLQKYIKGNLPKPEKLAELLSIHSFEVEGVKEMNGDFVLDIDVRPNRASDCFSHLGIARECATILNLELQAPDTELVEDGKLKAKDFVKVEIKNREACPRYTACVVADVKVGPSPDWLKQSLEACELQSINNIVDIVNYVMLETGQPLHVFDLEKLKDKKLIVRLAKKGEKMTTLDDQKLDLDESVLIISDNENPVAIAGIKGGKNPEISERTETLVLEAANFSTKAIRQGSRVLKLKTDASLRFEHGLDPNLTEMAINRAAKLIQELAGGKIAQGIVDVYSKKVKPKTINLKVDYIERLLGLKIPIKEAVKILKNLGFEILKESEEEIHVQVPTIRLDVSIPEDLIEEIGRIYGYDKIPSVAPKTYLISPEKNMDIFWEEFSKDILKESGFAEVYNYSFINQEKADSFSYNPEELLELENPLSENQQYLAPSLAPNLLDNIRENFKHFDEVKIFELGKVFQKIQDSKPDEKRMLSGLIAQKQGKEKFYQLKGIIDSLLERMGVVDSWYDEYQPTPEETEISVWDVGKSAEIKIGDKEIGFLGKISTKTLKDSKIKGEVVLFDIDFRKLQDLASEENEYKKISPYPIAVRDLSVLVPGNIKVVELLDIINRSGGELIKDVDLFDIYEGEELPEGKKNIAFHILYQAEDRTLSSEEVDRVQNKIIKTLEKNPEWEVRKQ